MRMRDPQVSHGRLLPWLAAYVPNAGAPTQAWPAAPLPAASLSVTAEPVG
jgi:hypothetical protein